MIELVAVAISFACMFIMLQRKMNFSVVMLITSALVCLISGHGVDGLIKVFVTTFTSKKTFETVMAVFMVSLLGGLCGKYGILDKIVHSLRKLIRSPKVILMIIPAMVGLLTVPGGAIMSVPFIDKLGNDLGLSGDRKAAINLSFRHVGSVLMPYSAALLVVSSVLPQMKIYKFILLNAFFFAICTLCGYFFFVRDIKTEKNPKAEHPLKELGHLIVYTSPIYACVLLNVFFNIPLYLGIALSIIIVYILSSKENFLQGMVKSVNLNLVATILSVLILQNAIQSLHKLLGIFTGAVGTGAAAIFILGAGSMFLSLITGMSLTSLGILLPMLARLGLPQNQLMVYAFFIFITSYIGYFFSPLHSCQVFTLQYLHVKSGDLYKEYRFYFFSLLAAAVGCFLILSAFIR